MQTVISSSIKVPLAKKCINPISRTELKSNNGGWKILERLDLRTKKCKTSYSNVVLILHEMHKFDNNNLHQLRNNVDSDEKFGNSWNNQKCISSIPIFISVTKCACNHKKYQSHHDVKTFCSFSTIIRE